MVRNLVLASGSPRRCELMQSMGLEFTVHSADVDEKLAGNPESVVKALAQRKAEAVAKQHDQAIIIAADTLVAVSGQTLGKPVDDQDAYRMLMLLQGKSHEVHTGLCVIDTINHTMKLEHEQTTVEFMPLSAQEILHYIASGEPHDKAGAYAIQGIGGMFINAIHGSFSNVIGLPTHKLRLMLREIGLNIL